MPTYYRPRVAHIEPGGADAGALVLIAAGAASAAAVVVFVLAHLVLLAAVAGVFVTVMAAVIAAMRYAASPKRLQAFRQLHPLPPAAPVRVISATRRRAIAAPASLPVQRAEGERQPVTRTR